MAPIAEIDASLEAALRAATSAAIGAGGAYDALIVGAGAAGSLAALRLTEAGLRVLVLNAGLTLSAPRPSIARRLIRGAASRFFGPAGLLALDRRRQPIQSKCSAWPLRPNAFVDDVLCPYATPPDRPFVWLRSRQLGGRMANPAHGRQCYRLSADDLSPCDGLSPAWPLRPAELDHWYALVERRLGLAGARDGLACLPDSEILHVLEPTPTEERLQRAIARRWPGAHAILGRYGQPFDLLTEAARTGRLLIREGAIAREIEVDATGRVRGVVCIDHRSREEFRLRSPLVFLCASALESTRLLLLSRSPKGPMGLGAASGVLGRHLMDHIKISAEGEGGPASQRLPTEDQRCLYLPRFDAREATTLLPGRGFGVQVYQWPTGENSSHFSATSFAEMLPRLENRVALDPHRRDAWGIPTLRIDCAHGVWEHRCAQEQILALRELAEAAEVTLTRLDQAPAPPGSAIHECGTARMGSDPSSSVLDPYNQCWEARGLYVTDGACFPSQGAQNPTLTILALTARACQHALGGLRGGTGPST